MRVMVLPAMLAACSPSVVPLGVAPSADDPFAGPYLPMDQAPPAGASSLHLSVADRLVRGEEARFIAWGANPGETVHFAIGMGGPGPGRCPARLGGLCLDILDRVRVIGTATADDGGSAVLRLTVPANATDGFLATFQAAIARGPGGASSVKSNIDQGMITSSPDAPVVSDLAVVTSWFATRYNVPSNAPQGAAWTGSEYVIPHSAAAGEFAVHQQDGTWVRTFDPPGLIAPGDPAWDGAAIWVDDEFDDAIYRVDPNGAILDVLPEPTSLSSFRVALAWDGAYLWGAGSENAGRSMVFQMDPSTGEVLCAFESACLLNGLAWRDGSLWGASPYGGGGAYLCEMTPAGQTVRSVPVDLNGADSVAEGLEWDGDQFVGTGYADDGAGVRWLAIKMELP